MVRGFERYQYCCHRSILLVGGYAWRWLVGVDSTGRRDTSQTSSVQPQCTVHCWMLASRISFDSISNDLSHDSFCSVNVSAGWRRVALTRASCILSTRWLIASSCRSRYVAAADMSNTFAKVLLLGVESYVSIHNRLRIGKLVWFRSKVTCDWAGSYRQHA
jgi:hypothetical protein